jgi:hypothetical protein
MNDKELSEEELMDIKAGLSSNDLAIEEGKKSKFVDVVEMAKKAAKNMPIQKEEQVELSEEDLEKMSHDYYHGDENAYRK